MNERYSCFTLSRSVRILILFPTNNEKHDRHSDADDNNPRFYILQPRFSLCSPRGFPKLVTGHIQTIARFLQILQLLATIHHFLDIIPHYICHPLDLQLDALNKTDIYQLFALIIAHITLKIK